MYIGHVDTDLKIDLLSLNRTLNETTACTDSYDLKAIQYCKRLLSFFLIEVYFCAFDI